MRHCRLLPLIVAASLMGGCTQGTKSASDVGGPTVAFKAARLIVETNATDGDAGLQLFLDHEPWRTVALFRPDGSKILEVNTLSVLKNYGLTELFTESSEPPFDKFPLAKFKELFPAGRYRLTGTTIEGDKLQTIVTLTHDFPAGPKITAPVDGSTVAREDLVVRWEAVATPPGIEIVGYQVLVTREEPLRVFSADMPASATSLRIPVEFLEAGVEYKSEVLAIGADKNQTLTEVTFKIS